MNHLHLRPLAIALFWLGFPLALCAQAPGPKQPAAPVVVDDPRVDALLQTKPQTPEEMTRAAKILIDLGYPQVAKQFVLRLSQAQLDDAALARLQNEFGTATFFKMSLQKELNPEATEFAKRVLDAANRVARDPKRLADLIARLQGPTAEDRAQAVTELRTAGDAAVVALLSVLADANRAAEFATVRAALVILAKENAAPLLGALEAPDPAFKAQVAEVLGQLRSNKAGLLLLAPALKENSPAGLKQAASDALTRLYGGVPTLPTALAALQRHVLLYLDGLAVDTPDADGNVTFWRWDAEKQQPAAATYASDDASLLMAFRLAEDLYQLAPQDREVRRLYLTIMLQTAKFQFGLGQPLPAGPNTAHDVAASQGPAVMEDVMEYAMNTGRIPAATAAAEILGGLLKADDLYARSPKPSILALAAAHPDRRLRFAAVNAILNLHPDRPYPGSSHVAQALGFFAGTSGMMKAVVADRSADEARRLGGLLAEIGFESDVAVSGQGLLKLANSSPDYALVLLATDLPYSNPDMLAQSLRRDTRSGTLPIGFVPPIDNLAAGDRLTKRFPHSAVIIRPRNPDAMQWQISRLLDTLGRDYVPTEERLNHAVVSIDWIAKLSQVPQNLYELQRFEDGLERALYVPGLAAPAAAALANLDTPASQRALADLASLNSMPLEARQAAAKGFATSVNRNGILLTSKEFLRQYDRYNQSEKLDQETQAVLGSVLDALESRLPKEEKAKP